MALMALLIPILAIGVLLIISELWWRHTRVHGEVSRKFVHITVGSFVAFWPFFLNWHRIELLSVAFVLATVVSKRLNLFKAIHSVQRPTAGELFFALAVGLTAAITHDKWIYMTALLQMSVADGLAAVIGVRYGRRQRYLVFGQAKSVPGTLTFAVAFLAILLVYNHFGGSPLSVAAMLGLTLAGTFIENFALFGLDNLLVPLLVAAVLRLLI
jgi:phytol kinase